MVELVEDFEDVKEHAAYCRIVAYRMDETAKGALRIRVQAGRFAFDGTMKEEDADQIIDWLKSTGAVRLLGSVDSEVFFA